MYLKSLTLRGFKSFAQPTTFEFEPGVTAVVGPNGSGKSNVVDALAWVMGEQGAKSLRGGKMEDVIFAGTTARGPLGRAEVKLTIDNSDGALPIDYAEVTISRTLFRSGASEYAINGEPCRLLDVQELLSDSGLGSQMHVIVGQGQLDAVLRATSDDRRAFIEEAAGILKHRKRKERTLRKLTAMETNLTRLSDLAGEVRRQLKPLGRQAEVAKKAQHIAATVRDAKARLLADDVQQLRTELEELNKNDADRNTEKIVLNTQYEQKRLRIQNIESEQQSDRVDQSRRIALDLERAQGKLRGLYEQVQQRLTFLATQSENTPVVSLLSKENIRDADEELKTLESSLPELEKKWEKTFQETKAAQKELDSVDEYISAQSALLAEHDLTISNLQGKVASAKQRVTTLEQDKRRRESSKKQIRERLDFVTEKLTSFELENKNIETLDSILEKDYKKLVESGEQLRKQIDEVRQKLHDTEKEGSALQAKLVALNSSLDFGDAAKELLINTQGVVAEHVRTDPGYEQAVEAALAGLADAYLVETEEIAIKIIKQAQEKASGRISLIVANTATNPQKQTLNSLEKENLTPIVNVMSAPVGVKNVLHNCYLTKNIETAQKIIKNTLNNSMVIVTLAGERITGNAMQGGSGTAPSKIELLAQRDKTEEQLLENHIIAKKYRTKFEELKIKNLQLKKEQDESLKKLRQADAQQAEVQKYHNRLITQKEAAEAELNRNVESLQQVLTDIEKAVKEEREATRSLNEAETKPKPIFDPTARDEILVELELLRQNELTARIDLETQRERIRAQKEQKDTLQKQLVAQREAQEKAAKREVLRTRQVTQAQKIADLLPLILDACDRSLSEARFEQQTAEEERKQITQELVLLRSEESELRERLNKLTEATHTVELKVYERKLALSALLERAADELGLVEEVLLAEYGPEVLIEIGTEDDKTTPQFKEFNRSEQELILKKAQKDLQELGRINPLALEEFAALEQRHSFLTEQLNDLQNTKKDLLAIIADIDHKMEGIFEAAFNDTKKSFESVFPVLFPGGTGDIFLTNPKDMLTTGIEVSVRPAGKKIERLSLLSGGERSLAAVAWLIAIFKARPSPFYIMDEVEAALDDANLGRLLQVFEELRENSQLIIVTHQKRTMEIADALYGVSIRGDGISVVVGQRVNEKE